MSAVLSSVFGAGAQFFTNQGLVLSGGKIYTYLAGTTSSQATWTDSTQVTQNTNPIVLDSAGRLSNEIWVANGTNYKFVLKDSSGSTLGTWDNIPGVNAFNGALSEWTSGTTPTYIGATSFSVAGNQESTYQASRRVQWTSSLGTFYGTIISGTYNGSTLTTVVVLPDSSNLDATLSTVSYGFMSATNTSLPQLYIAALNAVLTGTPVAPTAAAHTNTTQIATTAFVITELGEYALLASPTFSGNPTVPTQAASDNSTRIASTAFVQTVAFNTALPLQTGNSGKVVTTNGTSASWSLIGTAGQAIRVNLAGTALEGYVPTQPIGSIIYSANTQGAF